MPGEQHLVPQGRGQLLTNRAVGEDYQHEQRDQQARLARIPEQQAEQDPGQEGTASGNRQGQPNVTESYLVYVMAVKEEDGK